MNETDLLTIKGPQSRRPSYVEALRVELDVGKHVSVEDVSGNRINRKPILDYKAKILAGKPHASGFSDWLDPFIGRFGPRERCLSLGSGLGRVESYLIERGFTKQIEAVDLVAGVNEAVRLNEHGVDFVPGDLNFAEMAADSYDFILCHGVLHHLINLELVLYRINRALRKNGVLLIYEYIGESRWQFSEERMKTLQSLFQGVNFKIPPLWSLQGFESVRSSDLLPLVHEYFGSSTLKEVLYGGVYFPFVTCTPDRYDHLLPEVICFDEEFSQGGRLRPCYMMGVYAKAPDLMVKAEPWSDEHLDRLLCPPMPLVAQAKRALKRSPAGDFLRRVKRRLT